MFSHSWLQLRNCGQKMQNSFQNKLNFSYQQFFVFCFVKSRKIWSKKSIYNCVYEFTREEYSFKFIVALKTLL